MLYHVNHQTMTDSVKTDPFKCQHQEQFTPLRLVYDVHFFLNAIAILLITTNELYMTQWKCSHDATAKTPPAAMSKNKSQSRIVRCK